MGALGDVVRELNPLLWHVARAEGLTAEEAADVVQTTWLELLRRLQDIQSPRALTAWLVIATPAMTRTFLPTTASDEIRALG